MEDKEFIEIYFKLLKSYTKLFQWYNPKLDYETFEKGIHDEVKEILEEIEKETRYKVAREMLGEEKEAKP